MTYHLLQHKSFQQSAERFTIFVSWHQSHKIVDNNNNKVTISSGQLASQLRQPCVG